MTQNNQETGLRALLQRARSLVADRVAAQSGRHGDAEYAAILADVDAALSTPSPDKAGDREGLAKVCARAIADAGITNCRAEEALPVVDALLAALSTGNEDPKLVGVNKADRDWTKGTGYEVFDPIYEETGETSLQATYTPNNGIKLRFEDHEMATADETPWIEFHPTDEQAVWLAGRLLAWAADKHGATPTPAPPHVPADQTGGEG